MRADLVLFDADAVVDNAVHEPHPAHRESINVVVNSRRRKHNGARPARSGGGLVGNIPWNVLVRLFGGGIALLSGGSDISYSDWPRRKNYERVCLA